MTSAWPNLSDLLLPGLAEARIGLIGAPLGAGSVTAGRCDLAPGELRRVLKRIGLYDLDTGTELSSPIADDGDVSIAGMSIEQATGPIRSRVEQSVRRHDLTLLIGGNNAVTRPGMQGLAAALGCTLEEVGLITLDAHLDMRGLEAGLSNGNPVRALREDGLPGRNIVQIGLAPFANSRSMHEDALNGGHLVVSARQVREYSASAAMEQALRALEHLRAVFVDCDIDVIDRSQFPAAPGGRSGGLPASDFFEAARTAAAHPKVKVIDLTEWDPPLDPTDLSALTAGRWLAEVLRGFSNR